MRVNKKVDVSEDRMEDDGASKRNADKKSPKRNAPPSSQNKQTSKHWPGTEQKGN